MPLATRRKAALIAVLVLLSFCLPAAPVPDQFTPVLVSTLTPKTGAFLGTDLKQHVVYELQLTNANPTPATLQKIEVLDEMNPSQVLASYEGADLLSRLRTLGKTSVTSPEIEFGGARMFLLHLEFNQGATVPGHLIHRVSLLGGAMPAPTPQTPAQLHYTVAPVTVLAKVPVIGPPLHGNNWVALNACCEPGGAHRASGQSVNGSLYFAQRFAIDWMRLDDKGRLLSAADSDVHSYTDYGAEVLAVADGKVISTLKDLPDQRPGTLPNINTITIENVDGNHVILDLGNGVFAFYAHMQKDSITVSPGDHVKRGQVLGKLGNTGNTSGPHLHFHLMDSPSTLGSNGLPYVIDSFAFDGEIPAAKFAAADNLDGSWDEGKLATPSPRQNQFPMDLSIINFPSH